MSSMSSRPVLDVLIIRVTLMCMTICRPSPVLCPCWLQSSKAHFSALHAQQRCCTWCREGLLRIGSLPLGVLQPMLALQH